MTVGVVRGVPAVRVALFPHGVSTSQPRSSRLSTGSGKPWGDVTALAAGTVPGGGDVGGGVVGGAGTVVAVVVVVGRVPAARSSGTRAEVDPHAARRARAPIATTRLVTAWTYTAVD